MKLQNGRPFIHIYIYSTSFLDITLYFDFIYRNTVMKNLFLVHLLTHNSVLLLTVTFAHIDSATPTTVTSLVVFLKFHLKQQL